MADLTTEDLKEAVERNKDHGVLHLTNVLSYVDVKGTSDSWANEVMEKTEPERSRVENKPASNIEAGMKPEENLGDGESTTQLMRELRLAYLDILKAAYEEQVGKGELDARRGNGILLHSLEQSVDFASDAVVRGRPIEDWETFIANPEWADQLDLKMRKILRPHNKEYKKGERANTLEYRVLKFDVFLALSFIQAHRNAQGKFRSEFLQDAEGDDMVKAAKMVLIETEKQVGLAEETLKSKDQKDVCVMVSHLFCVILLNKIARDAEAMCGSGILKDKEAHKYVAQVEQELHRIEFCSLQVHPGEHEKKEGGSRQSIVCMLDEMKSVSVKLGEECQVADTFIGGGPEQDV